MTALSSVETSVPAASAPAEAPVRWTRVTLAGARRRVDVVLSAEMPVAALVVEALRLLEQEPSDPSSSRYLVLPDGTRLSPETTLADAGVLDGTLLRLVGATEAPPPPVVLDVAEELSDALNTRALRWSRRTATTAATLLAAAAAALATVLALSGPAVGSRLPVALVSAGLLAGGLLLAAGDRLFPRAVDIDAPRGGRRLTPVAQSLVLAAAAVASGGCWQLVDGSRAIAGQLAVAAATAIAFGLTSRAARALVPAGALGAVLLAGWLGIGAVTTQPRTAAVLAVVGTLILGQLPRFALLSAGLGALDDRRSADRPVRRTTLEVAVDAAHRTLAATTVVLAANGAVAGVLLVRAGTVWTVPLGLVAAGLLALRARSFPLAPEVGALIAAAGVVIGAALLRWADRSIPGATAVAAACGGVAVIATLVTPTAAVRARLRWVADRLEVVAVLASIPLAVGVFGLFGRLLRSFS